MIRIPLRDARKSVRPRPFQRKTARDVELVTEGGQLNFKKGMQDWLQARYGLALRTSFVYILAVKSQLRRMQGERAGSRKSQTGPGSGTTLGLAADTLLKRGARGSANFFIFSRTMWKFLQTVLSCGQICYSMGM